MYAVVLVGENGSYDVITFNGMTHRYNYVKDHRKVWESEGTRYFFTIVRACERDW